MFVIWILGISLLFLSIALIVDFNTRDENGYPREKNRVRSSGGRSSVDRDRGPGSGRLGGPVRSAHRRLWFGARLVAAVQGSSFLNFATLIIK